MKLKSCFIETTEIHEELHFRLIKIIFTYAQLL